MKVVILCGGQGTRIRDVSSDLPKPMIPIGPHPILWHIMKYYSFYQHKSFILCLGYKGNSIRDFFINYEYHTCDIALEFGKKRQVEYINVNPEQDWSILLAETGINAMTGARIKQIKKYVDGEDFMLTYGDGVGDIDMDALLRFHRSHNKVLTVTGVHPPSRFGELRYTNDGLVTNFDEKPQVQVGRISGGYFVCRKEIFNYLNDDEDLVFEQEPMRQLVKENQMMMFKHDGFWQPMDTHREYLLLNKVYDSGDAAWMKWANISQEKQRNNTQSRESENIV